MTGGTVSALVSPLQAAWLPVRQAIDHARAELDEPAFAMFCSMLASATARLHRELLKREWRRAA